MSNIILPNKPSSSAGPVKIDIRPYQKDALVSIWEGLRRAKKRAESGETGAVRAVCVQPTGSGKTVELYCLVREVVARWGWRCLVVEPTRPLVDQTILSAKDFIPQCSVAQLKRGKEFAGFDFVVSTAGALNAKALARIDPNHFQLVIIDEAHHAASESYEQILAHFSGAVFILGLTATYIRGDQICIASEKYFQSVIVYQTIGQLTTAGYLVPAQGHYFHTGLVLENVPIRRGNYDEKKLAHAVNIPERNAMAVDAWEKHALGRMSLVFTIDIDHAKNVAQAFVSRGIKAAAVWGDMDGAEYGRILEEFRTGRIDVVANSKLLLEELVLEGMSQAGSIPRSIFFPAT